MKAIILAGGKGRRMFPFDKYWQKAFMPVGNRPNALRLIDMLNRLDINDVSIVSGYKPEWANHAVQGIPGVSVAEASDNLGTVLSGLCSADSPTLILHGDIYIELEDLAQMIETPPPGAAAVALLQSEDSGFRKSDWICAKASAGQIEAFWGHPRPNYVSARSCGVFLLGPQTIPRLTASPPHFKNVPSGGMPPDGFWVENCLQAALDDGLMVAARYTGRPFVDMDYPWDYLEANTLCASAGENGVVMDDSCQISEDVVFKGGCIVGRGTVIRNHAIIGENCIIGTDYVIEDHCKIAAGSVIGNGCRIGFSAEVGGVLMDRTSAIHGCELYGVIGAAVDVGAGTVSASLRFDDAETNPLAEGKRCSHPLAKMVYVGDHSRTGVNSILLPGARMGANSALGPGVVLDGKLEHGTIVTQKQDLVKRDWGPDKYGW